MSSSVSVADGDGVNDVDELMTKWVEICWLLGRTVDIYFTTLGILNSKPFSKKPQKMRILPNYESVMPAAKTILGLQQNTVVKWISVKSWLPVMSVFDEIKSNIMSLSW